MLANYLAAVSTDCHRQHCCPAPLEAGSRKSRREVLKACQKDCSGARGCLPHQLLGHSCGLNIVHRHLDLMQLAVKSPRRIPHHRLGVLSKKPLQTQRPYPGTSRVQVHSTCGVKQPPNTVYSERTGLGKAGV